LAHFDFLAHPTLLANCPQKLLSRIYLLGLWLISVQKKIHCAGKAQIMPMGNLSDGQKSRVIFAWLAWRLPHLLLLDEPTNHLDIETIDSLAEALNEWDGGMVLVSHDFRLINQVAKEIWVCEKKSITKWNGDIMDFKRHLKKSAGL